MKHLALPRFRPRGFFPEHQCQKMRDALLNQFRGQLRLSFVQRLDQRLHPTGRLAGSAPILLQAPQFVSDLGGVHQDPFRATAGLREQRDRARDVPVDEGSPEIRRGAVGDIRPPRVPEGNGGTQRECGKIRQERSGRLRREHGHPSTLSPWLTSVVLGRYGSGSGAG
ncbi:MAG: hypothetical protein IPL59_05335 [Candidatus Competibacteraceae bacterium]|nr:hypothetical protein [Candidatus Competibacteraceae bacterium]